MIRASFFLCAATLVGCGATSNDGFDGNDAGTPTRPSASTTDGGANVNDSGSRGTSSAHDGGSGGASSGVAPSDGGTVTDGSPSGDADAGSTTSTPGDASTVATGAACIVAPTDSGGYVGGPSQSTTFIGTATEISPSAGAPQSVTLTITGAGEALCWSYDRCNAYVDITTNLWGVIGHSSANNASFSAGVSDAVIEIIGTGGGASGTLVLRAKPRSTHFTGTYSTGTATYNLVIDAPADIVPCTAVPNCVLAEGLPGDVCGSSIDGYGDTMYHCFSNDPATVVETCPNNCIGTTSGIECN